jgi:hypothetical protein
VRIISLFVFCTSNLENYENALVTPLTPYICRKEIGGIKALISLLKRNEKT